MQKIHIEISHLSPSSIDLLAEMLLSLSGKLPDDVLFELTEKKESITIPVSPGGHAPTVCCQLFLADLLYVTADRHYVRLFCRNQTLRSRLCFSELAALLPPDRFLPASRGILVNRDHIIACSRTECTMADHALLPISRSNRDAFAPLCVRTLTPP